MENTPNPLRVLFIASEAEPFVKVGGLGDVAGSLPKALHNLSVSGREPSAPRVDVRLVIPLYGQISGENYHLRLVASFDIPYKESHIPAEVYDTEVDGVPVYLIGGPPFSNGGPVYTGDPILDGHKFLFFSLAALELARALGWQPDIVHVNDWHTAAAVYALSTVYSNDPFFAESSTLLTIHNLPYLGIETGPEVKAFGLPAAEESELPWWAQDLPLPLGLLTADRIVAVSPTYAQEILTQEFGAGLYEFLETRKSAITGILNGIDMHHWDPSQDSQLHVPYSSESLSQRGANKKALLREFGLEADAGDLLLAMVTRMDYQKGVDLVVEALRKLAGEVSPNSSSARPGWQAVILGTGSPDFENVCQQLEAEFPDKIRVSLRFDPALSRRIYGGADALLIPSRYEPCGLAQMIAMRYGCVPIARGTGGLRDTVRDAEFSEGANGFLFEQFTLEALEAAILRALRLFQEPEHWRKLQRNGMQIDYSWERSALKYVKLYKELFDRKQKKQASRGIFEKLR